jgi:hypothetical protein
MHRGGTMSHSFSAPAVRGQGLSAPAGRACDAHQCTNAAHQG